MPTEKPNQYLDYLIDPFFQGVNRTFFLSFEDEAQRASYNRYYLLIYSQNKNKKSNKKLHSYDRYTNLFINQEEII